MTTSSPSPALAALLKGPGRRLVVQPDGRLKCSLTGHVMKAEEGVVSAHVSGAKYTRRAADADECEQLARAEPSLSKSRNFEGKWYCSLTCHVINATPSALRKHLEGKKLAFARALAAKGEHKAVPEPDLEEEEEEDDDLEEMEASEGEEEEEDVGGSGRAKAKAEAAAGAASKKEKGGTKKDKKKAASAPPPRTPDESVSKAKADASRPSRPKRARRGAA